VTAKVSIQNRISTIPRSCAAHVSLSLYAIVK
jgi:hypothetical protein